MTRAPRLSTKDNEYNPFTEYDKWLIKDTVELGHYSEAYLGRIVRLSEQMTEAEENDEIERAIDEIISLDFTHNYIKVEDPL